MYGGTIELFVKKDNIKHFIAEKKRQKYLEPLRHSAENRVFVVQPWRGHRRDEKLQTVINEIRIEK